ncbi:MAG: HisA/HisF-related TIM barrel protein [Acidimicrobiia bacterium]
MRPVTRVVPCLDIRDGRIVKGVKFQNLADMGDPATRAELYQDQGADEIVLLDVSATPEGRAHSLDTVRRVRDRLSIPLTVGGGVRTGDDAARLLDAGADKVGINTAAVARPGLIAEMADRFGSQCTVLAIDAARNDAGWSVVVRSGTESTPLGAPAWAATATDSGAGEILLTSWDRDGTNQGYDLELVSAVSSRVSVPVIASGGASDAADLIDGVNAGASAVLIASMLHTNRTTVERIKAEMLAGGIEVRPC